MAFSRQIKVIPENWNTIVSVLNSTQRLTKIPIKYFLADADQLEITTKSQHYYNLAIKALKNSNCLAQRRQFSRAAANQVQVPVAKQATKLRRPTGQISGYLLQPGDNTKPLSYGR